MELSSVALRGEHDDVVQRVAGKRTAASHPTPTAGRPASGLRLVAAALAVLVLLQAVVAGQSLFGTWGIEVHGWMGNASFLLGLLLIPLALRARAGRVAVSLAFALVVAMFSQIGLGYAGRTALAAASWHVPLGVAIFGLSVFNVAVLWAPTLVPLAAGGGPRRRERPR